MPLSRTTKEIVLQDSYAYRGDIKTSKEVISLVFSWNEMIKTFDLLIYNANADCIMPCTPLRQTQNISTDSNIYDGFYAFFLRSKNRNDECLTEFESPTDFFNNVRLFLVETIIT